MEGIMIANRFSIEEQNLICMYIEDTRMETIKSLNTVLQFVEDMDMINIFKTAMDKLLRLTEEEFEIAEFDFTDNDTEGFDYGI